MNLRLLFPALLIALALTACRSDADRVEPEGTAVTQVRPDDPAPEPVDLDAQTFDVTVDATGYVPNTITVDAGAPVRLVFTRQTDSSCLEQVQIPEYGIPPTDLPMGEPVTIEFTPTEAGTFTFVCGMDMFEGTIVVDA